jgi:hypothetical protein
MEKLVLVVEAVIVLLHLQQIQLLAMVAMQFQQVVVVDLTAELEQILAVTAVQV